MKITFVGTGTMGCTTRCNTSVLIDDLLFDIGMGTVKQIERLKIYMEPIHYIVISHFHADHFLDIPNLLFGRGARKETQNKLIIIGPKGLRNKIIDLMKFTHADGDEHKYDDIENKYNLACIELENGENYTTDKFNLTAFTLNHGGCKPVNGYVLEKENKKIAYACDTTFCDNYYKMCEMSDYMFSEVAKVETTHSHIGLKDFKEIYKKYPTCKFYALHREDYETTQIKHIQFPEDGEQLEI